VAETRVLDRAFYARDSLELAPLLLNKVVRTANGRAARIVEVEAYRGRDDPASHAYRGRSARNGSMFEGPGVLYVYRSYGIHWCANVVSGDGSEAVAVLLRAAEPVAGIEDMRRARWAGRAEGSDRDLCRGPGRLCQALGIDGADDGLDLTRPAGPVVLVDDGWEPPLVPEITPRVGISVAVDRLWRFSVAGHRAVSSGRPGRPRRAARSAG
jgi:DNA-3-methyladenine glycosylase